MGLENPGIVIKALQIILATSTKSDLERKFLYIWCLKFNKVLDIISF